MVLALADFCLTVVLVGAGLLGMLAEWSAMGAASGSAFYCWLWFCSGGFGSSGGFFACFCAGGCWRSRGGATMGPDRGAVGTGLAAAASSFLSC